MSEQIIDAYERVQVQEVKNNHLFVYALHFTGANHLQIGFGMESVTGLQKAHLPGAQVHELHAPALADWMRSDGRGIVFDDETPPRIHPFSSTMNVDMPTFLKNTVTMRLTAGRFLPLLLDAHVWPDRMARIADAVDRVRLKAFGHPLDWDVQNHDLGDGRFVWSAYDHDLKKVRIGLGYYDANNEGQYGVHTYACSKREAGEFVAFHFYYKDAPIQFMGLPPRWPSQLSPFVIGKDKQKFTTSLLKHIDRVWPGEVGEK